MADLHKWSALQAGRAIAAGKVTSEALVEACLDRIAEREDDVRAWAYVGRDQALAEARARDREAPKSPLHGVPVGVKDVFDTADMPTSYGSPIYAGHRPAADAACVALLRAAGMVVLGKTTTTEFAFRSPTMTRNPHNLEHTPGGSSSGSAAAVADFMVPLALGSQNGGIIRPASYCGIVGHKPTRVNINRAGSKLLSETLDAIGIFARDVADAASFAQILSGHSLDQSGEIRERPRTIGLCRTARWSLAEMASRAALEETGERLSRAGAKVIELDLPASFADIYDTQRIIQRYESWRALAYERGLRRDDFSPALKTAMSSDSQPSLEQYRAALERASACRALLRSHMHDCDVLLTPSGPGEAPRGLATTGDPVFNVPWTVLDTPCISLPAPTGPGGLPVGVQVIGHLSADAKTVSCSAWIEQRLQ